MKKIVGSLILLAALGVAVPQTSYSQVGVSFSVFYDGLSPYGDWISVGGGVYGWRPAGIAVGWRPYTVGQWAWTDDGWYWVSDEPWGWAAYHYGRWHYDEYYGWIWIPGYDWAPAWVEWRYGPDYIGWAPLSPYAVFNISWGIHYRTRWYTPHHWWSFVGCGYITHSHVHKYVYRSDDNRRFVGVTRGGGSVRYSGGRIVTRGPDREFVERRGNVRVEPVRVREVNDRQAERIVRDGGRDQIEVYRPRIEHRDDRAGNLDRPSRLREEGGRTLDLDTRKIDIRSRDIEREEGRDMRRAEEFRQRGEPITPRGRVDANDQRNRRPADIDRSRERQPQVQPEGKPRERSREGTVDRPRREYRSPNVDRPQQRPQFRTPERSREAPRQAPQNSGRSGGGGRGGRGR
ncbi:MAG: hypothetical protein HY961_12095 [Ignavibacteriae bacterium]|nr:hypothetical protein [Ignavibacteriota bacterium]